MTVPALAGDEESLREEVQTLRAKVETLEAQQTTNLESDIEGYLEESSAWKGAQGGNLQGVSISASFTAANQNTLGLDQFNRSVVNGDVDLDFDFTVTDNLDLFIHLNAASEGAFPELFGGDSHGASPGVTRSFGAIAGPTFAGLADGIGLNGTVSDAGFGSRAVRVRQAGIKHSLNVGDNKLHWEAGVLDQRARFNQNAFADDENTQFIHNSFDDTSAILWLNDATGRTVFGWHGWISFGDNKQFTLNWGWFNTPGQFFNNGQFMIQIHWKGEVNGREMNVRIMGFLDEFYVDGTFDGDAGFAASWDWWATDKIGVFFRAAFNGEDINPVENDFSVGAQFNGLIGSRPDDIIGVAIGFVSANDTVLAGIPEDTEVTLEIYYRYVMEDGKMHITPHLIYVQDPGGGAAPWADDTLFIIGIRIHVPF